MDIKNMERPERSTVIVCRELVRFDIDVAALSETRHDEEGNIRETGSTNMIFWKGKETRKQYIHGASFAIKKKLVEKQNLIPIAISGRLMTFLLGHDSFLTSFSLCIHLCL